MLVKPGLKTKQGLQRTGLYALAMALFAQVVFPDVDSKQALNSVAEIAAWWKSQGSVDFLQWIGDGTRLTAVGYIINALRDNKK